MTTVRAAPIRSSCLVGSTHWIRNQGADSARRHCRQKSEDDRSWSHQTRRCPTEWRSDALCPRRISGRKTLKCRIAFTVSSDEDDCIEKPSDVKAQFGSASILQDGHVVFNIGGNKYRIVVWINFPYRVVYIRFIGTHKQYDAIDAQSI